MKNKRNKVKRNYSKILLKILLILLAVDVVFIPLCIFAEVRSMVGIEVFLLFPLGLAIMIVLLSKNCFNSYERKKKLIEEKLSNR